MGLHTELPGNIEEVDVIIAGGGTAGCIIAGRLADADPDLSILVVEGGSNNDDKPTVAIPALFLANVLPETGVCNFHVAKKSEAVGDREVVVPSGGILGGGSSVNFMMYSRAQRDDLDSWKTPGWSANELLPYMQKLETYHGPGSKDRHGYDGPIVVSDSPYRVAKSGDDFIRAAGKLGYPLIDDLQSLDTNNGIERSLRYISPEGKRQDTASRYIHPKLQGGKHPNLHVLLEHQVVRVVIKNKKAVGLEFRPSPKSQPAGESTPVRLVRARKTVVLCCGAFGSPNVLERSGIGKPEVLERAKVPLLVDLPGVGDNYTDHQLYTAAYQSSLDMDETADAFYDGRRNLQELIMKNDKIVTWNTIDITSKIRPTDADVIALGPQFQKAWDRDYKNTPNRPLAIMTLISSFVGDPKMKPPGQFFGIVAFLAYPYARGHVHITGPDPSDKIDFETGYLADDDGVDIKKHLWTYKKGREIARRMETYRGECATSQPPFAADSKAACTSTDAPLTEVQDIEYSAEDDAIIEKWIRERVGTSWHSAGTCKMAPAGELGVVDAQLNVHGVQGLKVADMSIIPENVAANTNNTALVIGEKAADIIIKELGLAK